MTTVTRYPAASATGPGPRLQVLTNHVENPRASTLAGLAVASGTGGTTDVESVATGGPLPDCPSFVRVTWGAAQTGTAATVQIRNAGTDRNMVQPGRSYLLRAWVRSSLATSMQLKAGLFGGDRYLSTVSAPATAIPAGTWRQLALEFTAPAESTRVQINTDPATNSGAPLMPAGAWLAITGWMLTETTPGAEAGFIAYGDGDSAGWEWLGTPHASRSRGYGAVIG